MAVDALQVVLGVVSLLVAWAIFSSPRALYWVYDRIYLADIEARGYTRESADYQRSRKILRWSALLFALLMALTLLLRGFDVM